VVTDLVELQEKHGEDGLQVLGVTRFHGHGTDFPDGPKSGKQVGHKDGKLTPEAEVVVNEHFAKSFGMNFPIVFTAPEVSSKLYSIFAIPALFVIDREGIVVAVATNPSHEKLEALIQKALIQKVPAEETSSASRPAK